MHDTINVLIPIHVINIKTGHVRQNVTLFKKKNDINQILKKHCISSYYGEYKRLGKRYKYKCIVH